MKIFNIILLILTLCSCSQSPVEKETNSTQDSIVKIVVSGDTNSYTFKQDRFNGLREKMPGKLLDDKIWQKGRETYMTLLSVKHVHEKEFGGIYVRHWQWGQSAPEFLCEYQDTISCGEADVVISHDLDSLIIENIDEDPANEIILIYTLDCTYDVSSHNRYLVVISQDGKTKLKLMGWTREPGEHKTDFSQIDIKYDPAKDIYKGVDKGSLPEGKIENYKLLDKLSNKTKKRLIELWGIAFNRT